MTENVMPGVPIIVGRMGEDDVTAIVFDASAWVADYGAGTFALIVRRPGEAVGLPVTITEENGVVTWAPTAYDTEKRGGGEAQLVYTPIGKTKKSEIWTTYVSPSLTSPVAPPSSFVGWVDEVIAAAASITNMGATAETLPAGDPATVTKTVDPETGTVTLTFGVPAGEQGEPGATGRGVASVTVTDTGEWIISYTDGSSETVGRDVYSAILALAERAEDAQTAAETAQRNAEAAQGAAERAQESAEGAVQDAQTYAAQAIDAADAADGSAEDAEAYAIGERGGEDVPDTDPTYHNNAKYYAGQAEDAASAADGSAEDAEAYAIGERGGEGVPDTDPAYHNNAKYYAGQAETSAEAAGAAQTAAETAEDHAEAWATGGTGGTPSASNNAKKYAEDAADSAAAAAASAATLTLDGTLTQAGQAADAKATGDGIRETQGMIAPREATSTATQNYAVGNYLVYNGKLYKVTAAIANGETITPGTNVTEDKVATELLALENGKLDKNAPVELAEYANQLVSTVGENDNTPYAFRITGGSHEVGDSEKVKEIIGGTLRWNQMCKPINSTNYTALSDTTATFNDGSVTFSTSVNGKGVRTLYNSTRYKGHVWFCLADYSLSAVFNSGAVHGVQVLLDSGTSFDIAKGGSPISGRKTSIIKGNGNANGTGNIKITVGTSTNIPTITISNLMIIDLTWLFGSEIADYLASVETATPGAGVALVTKMFTKEYYAYDTGTLLSVNASAHKTVGFNAFDLAAGTAKLLGGMEYQITGAYTALSYSTGETITPDESGKFTPSENGVLTVTGGGGTTCVHLVWDGERDGQYEAYSAHTYALDDSLTLRGVPALDADNNLVYDGDEYAPDGTVTRRYGIVDLGQKKWQYVRNYGYFQCTISNMASGTKKSISQKYVNSYASEVINVGDMEYYTGSTSLRIKDSSFNEDADAFKTSLNGVYFVYELATPATEAADPYTETQICDNWGTEEFEDAGVAEGTRDVAIPVGHDSVYLPNLRDKLEAAPDSPSADGVYLMKRENGVNSYVAYLGELPADPTEDGTYSLVCTVADGTATLSWASNS